MNLDNLAMFTVIVELGSLTAAANKLSLPKSKLSRRLAELETNLGTPLIQRTTRRLNLTQAGEILFKAVQDPVHALSQAEHLIADYMAVPKGSVNVLFPIEFFNQRISTLVMKFIQQYPEIELKCTQYSENRDYIDDDVDLMFMLHEQSLPPTDYIAKTLMSFPQAIYVHPNSKYCCVREIDELINAETVGEHRQEQWLFRGKHQSVQISVNNKYCFSSPEMQLTTVLSNMAIAKLPEYVVRDNRAYDQVVELPLNTPPVALQLSVMYQHRMLPAKTRTFLNFFQSEIGLLTQ